MVSFEDAVLIELFAILLVTFAGFNELTNTYLLGGWDVVGNMAVWMSAGVAVGFYGLVAGLRTDREMRP